MKKILCLILICILSTTTTGCYKSIDNIEDYTENPTEIDCPYSGNVNTTIKNDCSISKENAINLCNEMLNKLSISDMEPIGAINLVTYAYAGDKLELPISYIQYIEGSPSYISTSSSYEITPVETGYCGYSIYYGKNINGASEGMTSNNRLVSSDVVYNDPKDKIRYELRGNEYLKFTVIDSGIVSMEYYNPTTIKNVTSSDTALLSPETIAALSTDNFKTYCAEETSALQDIDSIKLELMRIVDPDNPTTYTLVPAWNYYSGDSHWSMLTLNAIDGSVIDTYSGMYIN